MFARLVDCLKPGGWLVVEDGHWAAFEAQDLPEPIASVAAAMNQAARMREDGTPTSGPASCSGTGTTT